MDFDMRCPITLNIFLNPVFTDDGFTFEKEAIKNWLKNNNTSPITRLPISKNLIKNRLLRSLIEQYLNDNPK